MDFKVTKANKSILTLLAFLGCLLLFSCNPDMTLLNNNEPDSERILSDPEYVESLLEGLFLQWWNSNQMGDPAWSLSIAADEGTSRWGNWGMKDLNTEPRIPFNNIEEYSYRTVVEVPWYGMYKAIRNAIEIIEAIESGIKIGENGGNNSGCVAYAKFIKGISYGFLALFFDKAVIINKKTDFEEHNFSFSSYREILSFAVQILEESIVIMENNDFILPSNWVNGISLTNSDLVKVANSYITRFKAQSARNEQERQNTDWNSVLTCIDNGISEDFSPEGKGKEFHDALKLYSNNTGWTYVDHMTIGPSDTSGAFQQWLSMDVDIRYGYSSNFLSETLDRRISGGLPGEDGLDFHIEPKKDYYFGPISHISRYKHTRYKYHFPEKTGPMPILTVTEMNLLKAEALIRLGLPGAAELINITRVGRGELPPATDDDPDLFDKMKYEKRIECMFTASGLAFFDDRGWGDLTPGTPIHFPVPARELNILGIPVYTFGHSGEGSAPEK